MSPKSFFALAALPFAHPSTAFVPTPLARKKIESSSTRLHFFEGLNKAFEEEGPLGKGITVGKVQVALFVSGAERSSSESIFVTLGRLARENGDVGTSYDADYRDGYGDSHLSKMCHEICLTLLRKSDCWISACSDSEWFGEKDASKAEGLYNLWADGEASKFEKEYIPSEASASSEGNPTIAVVSLILELQGDETNFERAGLSLAETKSVLASIASDCRVEGGDCLNAFEVFWTPSEPAESLAERDVVVDFPELITL